MLETPICGITETVVNIGFSILVFVVARKVKCFQIMRKTGEPHHNPFIIKYLMIKLGGYTQLVLNSLLMITADICCISFLKSAQLQNCK